MFEEIEVFTLIEILCVVCVYQNIIYFLRACTLLLLTVSFGKSA